LEGARRNHHAPASQRLLIKLPKEHKRLGRKLYGVSNDKCRVSWKFSDTVADASQLSWRKAPRIVSGKGRKR